MPAAPGAPAASAETNAPATPSATEGPGGGLGAGSGQTGAHAIYAPTPVIPPDLREDAFQAVAIAHFVVAADGTVQVTLTQPTSSPRINEVLLETLKQWKFFPAMKDGIAINSEFEVRIPIAVQ